MKRVSYLALALALVLSLTACSFGSKKFERGVVEGQTYTSQFLGLTCTAPVEYTYLSDEEIAQRNHLAAEAVDSEELVKQMRESLENGNQVQDMYLMTADGLQTVNVMLVKVSAKGATVDMTAFTKMGMEQIISGSDKAKKRIKRATFKNSMTFLEIMKRYAAFVDKNDFNPQTISHNGQIIISAEEIQKLYYQDWAGMSYSQRLKRE